jgi:phosphatidylglycerophosphate synthase
VIFIILYATIKANLSLLGVKAMLENIVRNAYQRWLIQPFLKVVSSCFSATRLTFMAGIVGALVFPLLYVHFNLLATISLLFSGYLDTLDGSIAREQQKSSPTGAVLDIMTDRFVEIMVVLGLWSIAPAERSVFCLLILASILLCVTSFLIVAVFTSNTSEKSFHYSPGLIGRAETFIFFLLLIWVPHYFRALAIVFIALLCMTAAHRVLQFFKQVKAVELAKAEEQLREIANLANPETEADELHA